MKRIVWCAALALPLAALSAPTAAHAREYHYGYGVGVMNAPPPPIIVIHEEPHVRYVPRGRVYVVDDRRIDYDMFRHGSSWYVVDHGYWYRATRYRGPYRVIDSRVVPRSLFTVAAQRPR